MFLGLSPCPLCIFHDNGIDRPQAGSVTHLVRVIYQSFLLPVPEVWAVVQNLHLLLRLEVHVKAIDLERGVHSNAARVVVQEVENPLPESTSHLEGQNAK